MSLPKRLAYPRVYVEKLSSKNEQGTFNALATHEAFFKKVHQLKFRNNFNKFSISSKNWQNFLRSDPNLSFVKVLPFLPDKMTLKSNNLKKKSVKYTFLIHSSLIFSSVSVFRSQKLRIFGSQPIIKQDLSIKKAKFL